MKTIICIDPGASGGIAVRWETGKTTVHDAISETSWVQCLLALCKHRPEAILEKVGGYTGKGQPGSAMFKFGRNVGVIVGALIALGIPFREITPQAWQKAAGCGNVKSFPSKAAWKRHLRDLAQKRFPDLKVTLKTADALLMLDAEIRRGE